MKKITFLLLTVLLSLSSWRAEAQYFSNGFEGTFPSPWTLSSTNTAYTWHAGTSFHTGVASAICEYDPDLFDQNESLMSPIINLSTATAPRLKFWFMMSYYWGVDPNDNYDLIVKATTDGGATSTVLWTEAAQGVFDSFVWYEVTLDLTAYVGQSNFQLILVYEGVDGAQANFDDIIVEETPTCPAPSALTVSNITSTSASLGWTAGGTETAWNIEYGITGFTPGMGTMVTGVSNPHLLTGLTDSSTYQFYVQADCGETSGTSTWVGPFSWLSVDVPGCPTLVSPADMATNVPYGTVPLVWTAPTTGGAPTTYDVYLDTTDGSTLLGTINALTVNITGIVNSTTYYWKIIPRNNSGEAICSTVFSFTTSPSPFAPYCGPLVFSSDVEPITLVNVAGINNASLETIDGSPEHENFISIQGSVSQGETYPITLKGNTGGNWTNRFVVFVDWNQNNVLNDEGEVYFGDGLLTIVNSTGLDAVQAVGDIVVPADATLGVTRMRVKKLFGTTSTADPCLGTSYGQAEDYSLLVDDGTAGVQDNTIDGFAMYPNPVENTLTLNALNAINAVSVYNMLGQEVMKSIPSATQVQLDLTQLPVGTYVVKVQAGSQLGSYSLIKQ